MKSLQINFLKVFFCITLLNALLGFQSVHRGSVSTNSNLASSNLDSDAFQSTILQFTIQNHILGFGTNNWFVSNGTYALHIAFVGANNVAPISSNVSNNENHISQKFSSVTYKDLWDGIDLTYRTIPSGIVESVYEVMPYADTNAIRLRYNAPLKLNNDGSLTTIFKTGQIVESAPIAWQTINGIKYTVTMQFSQIKDSEIGFMVVGEYDHAAPLYIDPVLIWNTFLGGSSYDEGDDIILDGNGNVYITGYSDASWGNPIHPFSTTPDAFVAKLDSGGNLLWNTFLGGNGSDLGYGITLDATGNIYVTGNSTANWGSPIRPYTASTDDAFVAKLNASGNLLWNTFLGGTGLDEAREITIGGNGNVYVAGRSDSAWGGPIIRAYTASMDAFIANVDSNGTLVWNGFLGGSAFDEAYGIVIDGSGNLYITGYSDGSWGNPIRGYTAFGDAFVAKLNSGGNLSWDTFLGGGGNDEGSSITLDGNGNTYIAGYSTTTWGNPIRLFTAAEDAFATKIDTGGNLIWNTFLGGGSSDQATGIDTDGIGDIYVTGYSSSSWGSPVRAFTAGNDAFATKVTTDGNLIWNAFLGGNGQDYGYGIDADGNGNVYVIGPGNTTWGTPIRAYTADMDAFVAKLNFSPPVVMSTSLSATMSPGPGSFTVTFNEDVDNPVGNTNIDDATNPNNYLLINKGANGIANTASCSGGVVADDTRVTVTSVTYNSITFTSRVTLAGTLPAGKYRLFICGTTSIVDLSNNALAGDGVNSGTDYIFDFTVMIKATMPSTGFAPNRISSLPVQPIDKAYSSLGSIWLELPSQNIKFNIVGVPKSELGWDVTWLEDNVGWLNGTAFPSWDGNSVLTAHVTNANGLPGPFANIKKLKYGDQIIVHMFGEKYIFEVQTSSMVSPSNTKSALEHLEGHPFLTLITCQGYNPISDSYLFRRIIRAVLVSVKSE